MKKVLFGSIATVLFSLTGNAQTKYSNEDVRLKLATTMSQLVDDCRPSFKKGMAYGDYISIVIGPGPTYPIPTEEGNLLMRKTYDLLSSGSSADVIIKTYDGKEMAAITKLISNAKSSSDAAVLIFGDKIVKQTAFGQNIASGKLVCCKWLLDFANWIGNHTDFILAVLHIFFP